MSSNREKTLNDITHVEVMIGDQITDASLRQAAIEDQLEASVDTSENLLQERGYELPPQSVVKAESKIGSLVISAISWEDLLEKAEQSTPDSASINDLLTEEEIQSVLAMHQSIGEELDWLRSLDRYDLSLAVCAGLVAGVMDVLLVKTPAHPGFMGSKGSDGGWLSNNVKEIFGKIFTKERISNLERQFKTPYDPATNSGLLRKVAGLGPRTHRYHSLGHDVILGFFYGIRDILNGQFTAIDKYGKIIVQKVGEPLNEGEMFIFRLLNAIITHVGHLMSDVATPAGLPAPLMPLVSFLKFGKIGDKEYTVAEVARQMYRSGYDVRLFASSGIPVLTTGFIISLGNFFKPDTDPEDNDSRHYSARKLSIRRQRLIAHSVGLLVNAGKVSITKNPLAISWAQTLAFLRHLAPEMHFLIHGREGVRAKMVEDEILSGFCTLNKDIDAFLETQTDFVIQL